jgi:hypothetical protein
MREAGVGRVSLVRAAGAVDSLRIKEVNDDAQDFRMQLAQQAIDFRSEPPMEGHCNGNVTSVVPGIKPNAASYVAYRISNRLCLDPVGKKQ